jgi:hypothetical protein
MGSKGLVCHPGGVSHLRQIRSSQALGESHNLDSQESGVENRLIIAMENCLCLRRRLVSTVRKAPSEDSILRGREGYRPATVARRVAPEGICPARERAHRACCEHVRWPVHLYHASDGMTLKPAGRAAYLLVCNGETGTRIFSIAPNMMGTLTLMKRSNFK